MKELFFPRKLPADLGAWLNTFIIDAYKPAAPLLSAEMRVACVGSCFAQEIAQSLERAGKQTIALFMSERLNTPFALAYTFANAFDGAPFPDGFLPEHVTAVQNQSLAAADAYIITLGLSTCWYERATNKMVFAVKEAHSTQGLAAAFSAFEMRQTSVEENVAQIKSIIETIRRHKPTAPIVITLSPVPLQAVTSGSPIAGNIVSKATLRVAINDVLRQPTENLFYWPSYEIVEWVGKYVSLVWGQDGNDLRHLQSQFIDMITKRFIAAYYPA